MYDTDTHIHVWSGENSEFETTKPAQSLVRQLEETGVKASHTPVKDAGHAIANMASMQIEVAESFYA